MNFQRGHGYPDIWGILIALAVMVIVVAGLLGLLYVGIQAALAAGPEQTAYGGPAADVPWYVTLAIVLAPGGAAMVLTIATVIMVRRINRADGRPPLTVMQSVLWALGAGAAWGPLMQWALQQLVASLTGIAPDYRLIVIAPAVTGIASLVGYDLLRWWTKTRYPGLYALISVKHRSAAGHSGDSVNGDLTMYAAEGADDTIPRDP